MQSICTDIPTIANALRKSNRLLVNRYNTRIRRRVPFTGKKREFGPCKNFLAGNCKYGAKCKFKHEKVDSPLGAWTPVETVAEVPKNGSLKRGGDDRSSPAKRQRTDAAPRETSVVAAVQEPPTVAKTDVPVLSDTVHSYTAVPNIHEHVALPFSDPSFIHKLQQWGAAHFGPSARFPLPPPTDHKPTENNGWDTLCEGCQTNWTDYYKQQGWVADETAGGGTNGQVPLGEEGATNFEYEEDYEFEDEEYGEEDGVEVNLTPEMIEMFRHAENWRRERKFVQIVIYEVALLPNQLMK